MRVAERFSSISQNCHKFTCSSEQRVLQPIRGAAPTLTDTNAKYQSGCFSGRCTYRKSTVFCSVGGTKWPGSHWICSVVHNVSDKAICGYLVYSGLSHLVRNTISMNICPVSLYKIFRCWVLGTQEANTQN